MLARVVLTVAAGLPAVAIAQGGSVEERLARLERQFNSNTLVELIERIERLQSEVQELRGEIELQNHTVSQIKQRNESLYQDLDRRLQQMEVAGTPPSPGAVTMSDQPSGGAPALGASVDPAAEQTAYQASFDLLKAGKYESAISAFGTFLQQFPGGRYADSAQYWLGEAYYITRKYEPSLAQFQRLIDNYPSSQKYPNALLKMGVIYAETGKKNDAKRVLSELVNNYPDSPAAGMARDRLQRLGG